MKRANRNDYSIYPLRRTFKGEDSSAFTDLLIRHFTAECIHNLSTEGQDSALPLFVVGMVRSGTTLTENILGAHSMVKPGGEQSFWTQHANEYLLWSSGTFEIDHKLVGQLATEYLSVIDPGQPDIRYATDKNPSNIHLAPLLHCTYPNAKFVHLKRHPVDNLLSMWMTTFDESVRCASNRESLVSFYRDYLRLFRHLEDVLPKDRFATVRYEDLTSEPDKDHRRHGWRFLDLESEPACFLSQKKKG